MTTKKTTKWVCRVGCDVAGVRYEPGDKVPASVAKIKWLVEQRVIVEDGK